MLLELATIKTMQYYSDYNTCVKMSNNRSRDQNTITTYIHFFIKALTSKEPDIFQNTLFVPKHMFNVWKILNKIIVTTLTTTGLEWFISVLGLNMV